jgi:hypothetical protein
MTHKPDGIYQAQKLSYFSQVSDPNSGNPQLTLKVLKVEWDKDKDFYTYTVYDAKRDKYGIIVYFKPSNYLSLQYTGQTCSLDFEFYKHYLPYLLNNKFR